MRRRIAALIVLGLIPLSVWAKPEDAKVLVPDPKVKAPELSLAAGTEITVEDYDAKTNTFLIGIVAEPGVGPNFATPENLRKAIGFTGDQSDFTRQRAQMMGSIYQIKSAMPLVREDVMLEPRPKRRTGRGAP